MSFREIEHRYLEESRTNVRIFSHDCGLQVISLENEDPENMFSIGFSTTPEDNTGVTHILEHSVLAGSGKYPVKEPFMEMIKGSLATFINALTYQDHTVYPVASTVSADFFNLASVYFDAVFNPLLTENIFKQEGWHLELAKPGDINSPLKINGIVYNEMRGYMAEIDEVISKETYGRLLAKSPRRFISGGYPEAIPSLTYASYKKYYRNHYHPSVAKIFLYGNISTDEKLTFLDKCLSELDPEWLSAPVEPEKPRTQQPRWEKPKKATVHFMPALDADADEAAWSTAFLLENEWDPLLDISFDFLEYLLLGNASSPLRKAVLESKLCDSLAISGYDDETPETNFILAVTGIKPANFSKFEKLVDNTLHRIADESFTDEQIKTAFMQYKANRQIIGKNYVFKQMEKVFDVWCYGKDPFMLLDGKADLERLQEKLRVDSQWLPSLIRKYLIDNPHRLTLRLLPDPKLTEKADAKMKAKMALLKSRMSKEKLIALDKAAAELKSIQGAPNTEEELATLPKLKLSQVPKKPITIDYSKETLPNGIQFCSSDMFTNGMAYMEIDWPLSAFSPEQLLDMSLFTHYLQRMGTKDSSYAKVSADWAALGAARSASLFTCSTKGKDGTPIPNGSLHFSISGLEESLPQMLELLKKTITGADFTDRERFDFIANELKVKERDSLSYYGYTYAAIRAGAGLSPLGSYAENLGGLTSIKRNAAISSSAAKRRKLASSLTSITERLSALAPVMVTFTGSSNARKIALDFAASLPGPETIRPIHEAMNFTVPLCFGQGNGRTEGHAIASEVSACVRMFKAPYFWENGSIPMAVFANILSCGYLWNEIRIKGGAYGAASRYNMINGTFDMMSAQDPSPANTFATMDSVNGLVKEIIRDADFEKSIISSVKGNLSPIRPTSMAGLIRNFEMYGIDNKYIEARHGEYLSLTPELLEKAVIAFWSNAHEHNSCAIGPAGAVNTFPKLSFK